jgi:hypothetical protein
MGATLSIPSIVVLSSLNNAVSAKGGTYHLLRVAPIIAKCGTTQKYANDCVVTTYE